MEKHSQGTIPPELFHTKTPTPPLPSSKPSPPVSVETLISQRVNSPYPFQSDREFIESSFEDPAYGAEDKFVLVSPHDFLDTYLP